jgi:hypothetical protein
MWVGVLWTFPAMDEHQAVFTLIPVYMQICSTVYTAIIDISHINDGSICTEIQQCISAHILSSLGYAHLLPGAYPCRRLPSWV